MSPALARRLTRRRRAGSGSRRCPPARRGRRGRGRGRSAGGARAAAARPGAIACSMRAEHRQLLVVDLDRAHRGLGGGLVGGGDGRDRLAREAHAVERDDRAVLDRVAVVGLDVVEVGAGQDRGHARRSSSAARDVDAADHARARAGCAAPCRGASRPSPCRRRTGPARAASRRRPCAAWRRRPRRALPTCSRDRSMPALEPGQLARGLEDRAVAGAAAEVAVEAVADLLLAAELAGVAQALERQQQARACSSRTAARRGA